MTIAEKLYNVTKELPEFMQVEILNFAEFLKQKKISKPSQVGNIAQCIHQRFKNLDGENLPIPARRLSRIPPDWERR